MLLKLLRTLPAYVAFLAASAIASPGYGADAQGGNEGQPVPGTLFYNYPLTLHSPRHVTLPNGPSDDAEAGWTVAVGNNLNLINSGSANTYGIMGSWDFNNYSYGHVALELDTGIIDYHIIHGTNMAYTPPSQGGDLGTYQTSLGELLNILRAANASPDTIAYTQSVRAEVDRNATVEYVAFSPMAGGTLAAKANATESFAVTYKVFEERDLVVSIVNDRGEVRSSARVHVTPGSGVAEVEVTVPAPEPYLANAVVARLVPTGATAGQGAVSRAWLQIAQ